MTTSQLYHVETTRFGPVEVETGLTLTLPDGLIGFEDCRRYAVLCHDDRSPFRWLQCLDDGAVAFPVMEAQLILPGYQPTIRPCDLAELGLDEDAEVLVLAIVTVPRGNPRAMTANLLGPVVVNPKTRVGKQVILEDEDRYTTRFDLVPALSGALAAAA